MTDPSTSSAVTVGYNRILGGVLLAVGIANIAVYLAGSQRPIVGLVTGIVAIGIGAMYLTRPALVVEPRRVVTKSPIGMVIKDLPISSPADLEFRGRALYHRPTGEKLIGTGRSLDKKGVARLRALVESVSGIPPAPGTHA